MIAWDVEGLITCLMETTLVEFMYQDSLLLPWHHSMNEEYISKLSILAILGDVKKIEYHYGSKMKVISMYHSFQVKLSSSKYILMLLQFY